MAYDEGLAQRVREQLSGQSGIAEKRMFGGLAFLHNGNLCVGIVKDELMVRIGPDAHPALLQQAHARKMDFTGRPMRGLVFVEQKGLDSDIDLGRWIEHGLAYTRALPAK